MATLFRKSSKFFSYLKNVTAGVGRKVAEAALGAVHAVKSSAKKLDCGCCGESEIARLSGLENRQKEIFSQLGQDLFTHEKMGASPSLDPEMKKNLLEEAQLCEKEIRKIMEAIAQRKQMIELDTALRRAERDLKSPEARVRLVAVRVMARIGTKEIIPRLTEVLNDSDPGVRSSAAETIHRLVNAAQELKADETVPAPTGITPPDQPPAVAT